MMVANLKEDLWLAKISFTFYIIADGMLTFSAVLIILPWVLSECVITGCKK